MIKNISIAIAVILLGSCVSNDTSNTGTSAQDEGQLFTTMDPSETGVVFKNHVDEGAFRNAMFWDYFYNGGGVATGDINNDGLVDIFFTNNDGPNTLYLNKGDLKFEDISATALPPLNAWSTGANMIDINNDGLLDIYVCNAGFHEDTELTKLQNKLYINQGDETFKDETESYGVGDTGYSIQSSFFDYDNDGDLDLWINNHDNFSTSGEKTYKNAHKYSDAQKRQRQTRLYRNDNGRFTDVSQKAGINKLAFGLGLATADFNDDGWTDVYVANDYFLPDFYFINNQDGTFTNMDKALLGHTSYYAMGCDAADFNNDSELDFVTVDMTPQDHFRNKTLMESMDSERFHALYYEVKLTRAYMFNSLQAGMGMGHFSEVGQANGIGSTEWSWAPLMADFNNDGFKDIYVTNGYYRDSKDNDFKRKVEEHAAKVNEPYNAEHYKYYLTILNSTPVKNRVFRNQGEKFEDATDSWSDLEPTFSNGAAYADLDNDGDLDMVINNLMQTATFLRNNSKNNFLRIKLLDSGSSNSVLNTKAELYIDDKVQRVDNYYSRGFQSSVEPILHFGLGKNKQVDKLVLTWPDNTVSEITDLEINTLKEIDKSKLTSQKKAKKTQVMYAEKTTDYFDSFIMHKNHDYNDFEKEVLLPHKYSNMGPCLAVADVDGDGNEDVFVGSSNGNLAHLFLQQNGKFVDFPIAAFDYHKDYEDLGALFFDYDNDGDKDLYVASGGGGEILEHMQLAQDRLYVNMGEGKFLIHNSALPKMETSTKAVVALDADKDGDLDLVVGGRNVPGKYPLDAPSYYLENQDGKYTDKTKEVLPSSLPGMITDLEANDVDGDGDLDLVVTGEWSSPQILRNDSGKFTDITPSSISKQKGWWQSIIPIDANNDGHTDFIVGNIGENNKFHPSNKKPLGVLANDFDKSGTIDIVLTKQYKDMTVPVRGKECSSEQMPFLNEKFPTYAGFASSSIEDILGEEAIASGEKKSVNNFSSYLITNDGKGKFSMTRLPEQAQWFPILDGITEDFDQDGNMDVFLAGNKERAEPETPSYDAGKGLFLMSDGNGNFRPIYKITQTGILANRNVKAVASVNTKGGKGILVANNDTRLQYFVPNQNIQ